MKKESFPMNRTVRKNSLLFLAGSGLYTPFWKCCGAAIPTPPWHLPAAFVCCSSTPYAAQKMEKKKPSGALRHRAPLIITPVLNLCSASL